MEGLGYSALSQLHLNPQRVGSGLGVPESAEFVGVEVDLRDGHQGLHLLVFTLHTCAVPPTVTVAALCNPGDVVEVTV